MKKIGLNNRYGHNYWLEPYDENIYVLKTDEEYDWPFYLHSKDDIHISAVDWDGADPICVGGLIEGRKIIKITNSKDGYLFEVEN